MIVRPPKLILFNGPRHSGKDEASLHCERVFGAHHFKMSHPLKSGIKTMFDLSDEQVAYLETIKTQPTPLLHGKSYVEVQISLSEDWFKVFWDDKIFGEFARVKVSNAIKQNPETRLYVCSDSGFASETGPVAGVFGPENTLLVHIERPGKTFDGDSRSYITLPYVTMVTLTNDGTVEDYHRKVEDLASWWLKKS